MAEAALLAGLVKAPSSYAPTVSVDRALARRRVALNAMRQAGTIDTATFESADGRELNLRDDLRARETYGGYFKEEVRKQLIQQFGAERVYEGGLKVYTTIDPDLQRTAEAEVLRAVASNRGAAGSRFVALGRATGPSGRIGRSRPVHRASASPGRRPKLR